jgi:putative transcriptional regulator
MKPINLTNQFLIAMPGLADPNFFQTVIYVFSHNDQGAMGIVINRPLSMDLGEIFTQMDLTVKDMDISNTQVYDGGPVKTDRGFIIHKPDAKWQSSIHISDKIEVTTSRDILEAISNGYGPEKSFIALGYAGWTAGQLEQELMDNCWLNTPSDTDIIFDAPAEQRWEFAASLLGVNMQNLSSQIGHA